MNVVSRVTKVTHLQEYRVEPQAATVTRAAATVLDVTQATGVTARYISTQATKYCKPPNCPLIQNWNLL